MHEDEVDIDDALVGRLLAAQNPGLAELELVRLETWGTDHVIYRLGDNMAVRLPKIGWASGQGKTESAWLPVVAPHLPAEVPVPIFLGIPDSAYPHHWYVAPWIDGDPVEPETADLSALATDLASFVTALQRIDTAGAPKPRRGSRGGLLIHADAATRAGADKLRSETDVDALLVAWQAGVDAPPWAGPPIWTHGDLMDGNLLLRNHRLAAVIDWGGLKAGDPAVDLMIAWSLFTPESRQVYLNRLDRVDDAMWRRGRAWALFAALLALPYYHDTNPDIVARSWRTVDAVLADVKNGGSG
jgi:aminoglycoside phosphotransferase (APT) family kinase protein